MTTDEESTSQAVAEHEAGRMDRAEAIYRARLAGNPRDVSSLIGLGDVLTDTKRLKEAEDFYRQAIAIDSESPAAAGAFDGLAAVLQDTGDLDNAIAASKKAAILRGNADDSFGVGNTLEFLGRIPDAVEMYKLAASQRDGFADAHVKAAQHLFNMGQPKDAISHYQAATLINPNAAELYCNLANAQHRVGDANAALDSARRAIEIKPTLAEAHNIMGVLWKERRRWADALLSFNRALQAKPDAADAFCNMGLVLEMVGRDAEATSCFDRAAQLRPDVLQYHVNLAAHLLLIGEYPRGWSELEWRRSDPRSSAGRTFPQPTWNGAPLNGATILIHAENPRSQTIQFLRYLPFVVASGGRILLECQEALAPLARQIEGVAEVVVQGQPLPHFDCHCPIVSLAQVFGTTLQTIPNQVPYLQPAADQIVKWGQLLPEKAGRLRIGLAWKDPEKSASPRDRNLTIDRLLPLATLPGISLFNLQQLDAPLPAELNIIAMPGSIDDLHDTAALIHHMDLIIGCDCTASHLAGAMGKKTSILIPSIPNWHWMRDRVDSPWYPTVNLLRQSAGRGWTDLVNELVESIKSQHSGA